MRIDPANNVDIINQLIIIFLIINFMTYKS